ncbi:hypothetical protein D3C72_915930 [compost metagenome]
MTIQLIWSGKPSGVLVPGAQDVWYVAWEANDRAAPPLSIIRMDSAWPYMVGPVQTWNGRRVLEVATVKCHSEEMRNFGAPAGVLHHRVAFVSDDGHHAYLLDDNYTLAPTVRRMAIDTGIVVPHAALSDNMQFDRHLSLSPTGHLVAVSGMGVELWEPSGLQVGGEYGYLLGDEGDRVSAGSAFFAFFSLFHPTRLFDYEGRLVATIPSDRADPMQPGPSSPSFARSVFIDRWNRIWILFVDEQRKPAILAIYASDGTRIAYVSLNDLPLSKDRLHADSLVGIDREGNLWWLDLDGVIYGTRVLSLTPNGLEPSLRKRGDQRTGLEPTL